MAMVILSALVTGFSVSRMSDFFGIFLKKLLGNLLGILCFNLFGHLLCIVATLVLPKITGVKTCCIKFCLCKKRHFASAPHCSAHCEPLYFFSIPNFNI